MCVSANRPTPLLAANDAASAAVRCPLSRAMAASRCRNVASMIRGSTLHNVCQAMGGFAVAADDKCY